MEDMVVRGAFWRGKRVLVTGHTGFKGGWLTFWLAELGAEISGIGLVPPNGPNLYDVLDLSTRCHSSFGDINQPDAMASLIGSFQPEIIIHMAAQALVRRSYEDPVGTYETNVLGVMRLLDAVRKSDCVKSVVVVTSDKCYENRDQIWGYREDDPLGGHDPYSSSKAAAEIVSQSMQRSFFQPFVHDGHPARIATVRAGNVIGGGDWSQDRLVPDIVRGLLGAAGCVELRNPNSVRPWQHVLEPVGAYLEIAELLATHPDGIDQAWNIGPDPSDARAVADVALALAAAMGKGLAVAKPLSKGPHEANLLTLDCTKARIGLGWRPRLGFDDCIQWTADWYGAWNCGQNMADFTRAQIAAFEALRWNGYDTSLAFGNAQ